MCHLVGKPRHDTLESGQEQKQGCGAVQYLKQKLKVETD